MHCKATLTILALLALVAIACAPPSQETKDQEAVQQQQSQYAKGQPVPVFDWSLERDLVIQLYTTRNQNVATHSVWRSDYGMVEGDCPSMGYGLPYDTSLTNPQQISRRYHGGVGVIGQAEPNGVFASTNTAATWVMCIGPTGGIEPVYVETKVTAYPYPVEVDYAASRVQRAGASSVTLSVSRPPALPTTPAPAPPAPATTP